MQNVFVSFCSTFLPFRLLSWKRIGKEEGPEEEVVVAVAAAGKRRSGSGGGN